MNMLAAYLAIKGQLFLLRFMGLTQS